MRWLRLLLLLALAVAGAGRTDPLGGPVPGLVGGVCDDRCWQFLADQTTFLNLPSDASHHWFTCDTPTYLPAGDDGDDVCTQALPCTDLEKIQTIHAADKNSIFHLDHCTWDAAPGGELETWDGLRLFNNGTGSDVEDDPAEDVFAGAIVPAFPALVTDTDRPKWDLSGNGTITGGFGSNPIHVSGGGNGWIGIASLWIDHFPQNPGDNLSEMTIAIDDLKAVDPASGPNGFIVLQNFRSTNAIGQDVFPVRAIKPNQSIISIGSDITLRDPADFDEDCLGATCAANDPVPQPACSGLDTPYPNCTGDTQSQFTGRAIAYVQQSTAGLVVGGEVQILHTQNNPFGAGPHAGGVSPTSFALPQDSFFAAIGATCRYTQAPNTITGGVDGGCWFGNPTANQTIYVAHTLNIGPDASAPVPSFLRTGSEFDGVQDHELIFRQNTVTGFQDAIEVEAQFPGDTLDIAERCNVIDGLKQSPAGEALLFKQLAVNTGLITLDTDDDTIYDCDDGGAGGGCFRFEDDVYANVSAVDMDDPGPALGSYAIVNQQLFGGSEGGPEGPQESGGAGVDGNAMPADGDGVCSPGEACDRLCTDAPFTLDLPPNVQIPTFHARVTTIRHGTHLKCVGGVDCGLTVPALSKPAWLVGFVLIALAAGRAGARFRASPR